MDKTNLLLETLRSTMKTLVDVEQRKSTLVAQATQAAKAASLAGTTSSPASSPPGSAPAGFVAGTPAGGAPQATLGTGMAAPPPAPKLMPTRLHRQGSLRHHRSRIRDMPRLWRRLPVRHRQRRVHQDAHLDLGGHNLLFGNMSV